VRAGGGSDTHIAATYADVLDSNYGVCGMSDLRFGSVFDLCLSWAIQHDCGILDPLSMAPDLLGALRTIDMATVV